MANKVIPKIQVADEAAQRALDRTRAIVNPVIKRLQSGTQVTGSKGGNAALAALIAALAAAGIISDGTT